MIENEDQKLDRADTKLSLASTTNGTIQTSPIFSALVHHKHRHNHNIDKSNNNLSSLTSDLLSIDKKSSRDFLLYNRCSGGYLNIIGKTINTTSVESQYSLMSLQTQTYGTHIGTRILSKNAGVYLCFNKKGKLITRFNGNNIGCLFSEIPHASRYIKLNSLYNPDWFIGFNRNGRPMSGKIRSPAQHIRREKCYHFVKKSQNNPQSMDSSHEMYNNNHRDINSYNFKAGPNVINTENSYVSKNNEKSLHLMSPESKTFSSHEMGANSSQTIISHNQNSIFNQRQRKVKDEVNQRNDFKSRINVNLNHDYQINHNNNHNSEYHSEHHQPLR